MNNLRRSEAPALPMLIQLPGQSKVKPNQPIVLKLRHSVIT
jgi:hypothetical protein